ncbi:hypothetical protein DL96DRAFT_1574375 [Flagelloscypha sp. PMI_526]|nr:hypothetical protein DL96DRAFT_1574375 [Flagelloscypha sp. PMI_526]
MLSRLRPSSLIRRRAYLVLLGSGLAVAFTPKPKTAPYGPSEIASSPSPRPLRALPPLIPSPAETDKTIAASLSRFLHRHVWEPLCTTTRFVYLLFLFFPVIVCSPMLLVGRPEEQLGNDTWGAAWWYDLLVDRMQAAGPTFVKLAQWAGSRRDLFPALLCERFGTLHSSGKPHSIQHTKNVIEHVFKRPFQQVFVEFNEEPIGTGAIAQVYRATLNPDLLPPAYLDPRYRHTLLPPTIAPDPSPSVPTAAVAVKVLHPRAEKTISRDLRIMAFFARAISLFPSMQWLSLPDEVSVFGDMMFQQLDLRHEAENLDTFEKNFASRAVPVRFPRPVRDFSTQDILIEEFQDAVPLEDFLHLGGGAFDEALATLGLDAFLNMLLLDNFVHSDLHPGNIMVKFTKPLTTTLVLKGLLARFLEKPSPLDTEDLSGNREALGIVQTLRSQKHDPNKWRSTLETLHSEGYYPEIIFIDAGLTNTLSSTNRRNFLDLFRAIAEFDGYRAGELMVDRCRTPKMVTDKHTFALEIQHLALSVKRRSFSLGQIQVSDVLTQVLKSVRRHHVRMEADFVNTVLSILLLEGIGRTLDPDLDLFKSALPILRQVGGQLAAGEVAEGRTNAADRLKNLPKSDLGALLKVVVWAEARSWISSAGVNTDELIKYDW